MGGHGEGLQYMHVGSSIGTRDGAIDSHERGPWQGRGGKGTSTRGHWDSNRRAKVFTDVKWSWGCYRGYRKAMSILGLPGRYVRGRSHLAGQDVYQLQRLLLPVVTRVVMAVRSLGHGQE